MNRIRIFISSPGDVADERQRALAVVERLQQEFSGTLVLEPLLWEQEPLLATADFQSQIRSPADFDIFATIIGCRLGSPLGSQFTRRDGSPYSSGTEFEFEVAVASYHASGRPEPLVYRKSLRGELPETAQIEKVSAFFDKWFQGAGNPPVIGEYHSFTESGEFEELFTQHLRELLHRFLPRPNNLPAPISSFVGRTDLIREITGLLEQATREWSRWWARGERARAAWPCALRVDCYRISQTVRIPGQPGLTARSRPRAREIRRFSVLSRGIEALPSTA